MKSICFPPCAFCLLPTAFEGSWSWRDSPPAQQPGTQCLLHGERGNSSNFKNERTKRGCL
jgi:hypothetical protein